jgi:hypothetical protein
MKRIFVQLCSLLLCLLFVYTATNKFLDFNTFVFQMRLAPVPWMQIIAPVVGWVVPLIEFGIAIAFAFGAFNKTINRNALLASVILLSMFEIYITTMLLSGSELPCTCGGIISTMGWKQHLIFNAVFIIAGIMAIRY